MCEHTWKTYDSDDIEKGYNCIRQCVYCGMTERYTHIIHEDGREFFNRTMLSGPF